MRGTIDASLDDLATLGQGYLVSIDLGQEDGVVPGNVFTIYRYVYDGAPRKVLGTLAVLTVQREHSTARIMESKDYILRGRSGRAQVDLFAEALAQKRRLPPQASPQWNRGPCSVRTTSPGTRSRRRVSRLPARSR